MSNMQSAAAFQTAGIQELNFDEIDMIAGAVDWGEVGSSAVRGAAVGAAAGAAGGAAAGSLAGGVGAGPGAVAGGVSGGVAGAVYEGLSAVIRTWGD